MLSEWKSADVGRRSSVVGRRQDYGGFRMHVKYLREIFAGEIFLYEKGSGFSIYSAAHGIPQRQVSYFSHNKKMIPCRFLSVQKKQHKNEKSKKMCVNAQKFVRKLTKKLCVNAQNCIFPIPASMAAPSFQGWLPLPSKDGHPFLPRMVTPSFQGWSPPPSKDGHPEVGRSSKEPVSAVQVMLQ